MNSNTALRERVFQLVCDNWTDEAIPDAEGALGDLLRVLKPGDELRKALGGFIHWDDGSWLERIARTCFGLPFNDTGPAPDWESLLTRIENSNHPMTELVPAPRRLYTCCPDADCKAFQDGLSFLRSFGFEPTMDVDDEGHHYFEFTVPTTWSLDERRRFNKSLADKVRSDKPPCENCGNVMYSEAWWATCKVCKERFFLCEECMLIPVSLCRCTQGCDEQASSQR